MDPLIIKKLQLIDGFALQVELSKVYLNYSAVEISERKL